MIKKQNLRINVLAAAVLSMTAVGAVHAAGFPTREPVRQASTAEPGTSPPPSARSNSAMPVGRRGGTASGWSNATKRNARPPEDKSCFSENTVAAASSASVFHSAQSAH